MNRSGDILNYLSKQQGPAEIIIAPNAPPVTRVLAGVELALNVVLDSADAMDTLMALRARSAQPETAALPQAGSFSFGVPDVGRFRVAYVTQRGSKAVRIVRVPFTVPDIDSISRDPRLLRRLSDAMLSRRRGVVAICGTSAIANSKLAYALLRCVNDKLRAVICVLERSLTYLMAHGNSIVVQTELGIEVPALDDGVRNAFLLEPDVIFVGDLWPADEVPSLARAIEGGTLTVLSSVALSGEELLRRFAGETGKESARDPNALRLIARVFTENDGMLRVELEGHIPE
ncbi:MAG: hypothetical protein FJ225_06835 [Lentisphaerae bacterium]|nr:hypothetical protein [Lentisphaerota bacterium]